MAPNRLPDPAEQAEIEASRAPFLEHLEELRRRLWRAILAVIGAAVVAWLFHEELYAFLTAPLFEILARYELEDAVKFRTIQGAFVFYLKVAILGGFFLGLPVVLYQLWQFVAPGLYRRERRVVLPFVVSSTLLFTGGALFAYYLVLPYAFDFMLGFSIREGPNRLLPDITIEDYLGFVTKLLLAFGVIFEMPLAVAFLASVGVVTHRGMIKWWRYAVVGAFVVGAVLTPPDWITQTMLAIPLIGLYGISIGLAYLITTRREREIAALDAEGAVEGEIPVDSPGSG